MPPILILFAEVRSHPMPLGFGPALFGVIPIQPTRLTIVGVTRDSTGAILGSCSVHLFRTADDVELDITTSDATTGAFTFSVGLGVSYYMVAYKPGSPDVAGTTLNTLVGV